MTRAGIRASIGAKQNMSKMIALLAERVQAQDESGTSSTMPHKVVSTDKKVEASLSTNTFKRLPVLKRNHCLFPYLTICIYFYLLFMSGHETNSVALVQTYSLLC